MISEWQDEAVHPHGMQLFESTYVLACGAARPGGAGGIPGCRVGVGHGELRRALGRSISGAVVRGTIA